MLYTGIVDGMNNPGMTKAKKHCYFHSLNFWACVDICVTLPVSFLLKEDKNPHSS